MSEQQVWDDERIIAVAEGLAAYYEVDDMRHEVAKEMRRLFNDMQAQAEQYVQKNDHLHSTCTEFAERIDALERQLASVTSERDDLAARVNDGEAVQMLRWIVDAYSPQWWYTMEKTGYECAFCGNLFKTRKEFQEIADHKLGCQWSQTKWWLESQPIVVEKATQGTGEGVGEDGS